MRDSAQHFIISFKFRISAKKGERKRAVVLFSPRLHRKVNKFFLLYCTLRFCVAFVRVAVLFAHQLSSYFITNKRRSISEYCLCNQVELEYTSTIVFQSNEQRESKPRSLSLLFFHSFYLRVCVYLSFRVFRYCCENNGKIVETMDVLVESFFALFSCGVAATMSGHEDEGGGERDVKGAKKTPN